MLLTHYKCGRWGTLLSAGLQLTRFLCYRADAPIMAHMWEYCNTRDAHELGYSDVPVMSNGWPRFTAVVLYALVIINVTGLVKLGLISGS